MPGRRFNASPRGSRAEPSHPGNRRGLCHFLNFQEGHLATSHTLATRRKHHFSPSVGFEAILDFERRSAVPRPPCRRNITTTLTRSSSPSSSLLSQPLSPSRSRIRSSELLQTGQRPREQATSPPPTNPTMWRLSTPSGRSRSAKNSASSVCSLPQRDGWSWHIWST